MDIGPFPIQRWQDFQNQAPVAALLETLPELRQLSAWPSIAAWQAYAEDRRIWASLPRPLSFRAQKKLGQRAKRRQKNRSSYETAIVESQEIPTREGNLHDFLNALIWLVYPQSKWTLHEQTFHAQKESAGNGRTRLADRMTCFDEGGVILELSPQDSYQAISELLCSRDDAAKEEFCRAHRQRFSVFGHGMLEVLFGKEQSIYASCCLLPPCEEGRNRDERLAAELAKPVAHGTVDVLWFFAD